MELCEEIPRGPKVRSNWLFLSDTFGPLGIYSSWRSSSVISSDSLHVQLQLEALKHYRQKRICCLVDKKTIGSHTVTLKLLQRLSDQNRTEKLREAMEACGVFTLRTFCQDVGLCVRRKKYEAYQCKAGFIELLTKKLASKTKAKRNKIATSSSPPPSKKQSYLLLLRLILSEVMPSTLLEEVLSHRGEAAGAAVRVQSSQKMKHRCTIQPASVEKASTLVKEIFPSGSRAAAMVDTELTRSLQWLAAQSEEDEGSDGSFMEASN